MLAEKKKKG